MVKIFSPTPPIYEREARQFSMVQAYCVKCRGKKEIKNPKQTTLKNGRPATKGVCPDCGTGVFRIGKA